MSDNIFVRAQAWANQQGEETVLYLDLSSNDVDFCVRSRFPTDVLTHIIRTFEPQSRRVILFDEYKSRRSKRRTSCF
jgi:hypothetical protein